MAARNLELSSRADPGDSNFAPESAGGIRPPLARLASRGTRTARSIERRPAAQMAGPTADRTGHRNRGRGDTREPAGYPGQIRLGPQPGTGKTDCRAS